MCFDPEALYQAIYTKYFKKDEFPLYWKYNILDNDIIYSIYYNKNMPKFDSEILHKLMEEFSSKFLQEFDKFTKKIAEAISKVQEHKRNLNLVINLPYFWQSVFGEEYHRACLLGFPIHYISDDSIIKASISFNKEVEYFVEIK